MSTPIAAYSFLPWIRQGTSRDINIGRSNLSSAPYAMGYDNVLTKLSRWKLGVATLYPFSPAYVSIANLASASDFWSCSYRVNARTLRRKSAKTSGQLRVKMSRSHDKDRAQEKT